MQTNINQKNPPPRLLLLTNVGFFDERPKNVNEVLNFIDECTKYFFRSILGSNCLFRFTCFYLTLRVFLRSLACSV